MFCKRCVAVVFVAAATFSGTATAADPRPLPHMAWIKISDAYTAQAQQHGAKAVCTEYDPTGTSKMGCSFGPAGRVVINRALNPCLYRALVFYPGGSAKATITLCGSSWALAKQRMPAPWTMR